MLPFSDVSPYFTWLCTSEARKDSLVGLTCARTKTRRNQQKNKSTKRSGRQLLYSSDVTCCSLVPTDARLGSCSRESMLLTGLLAIPFLLFFGFDDRQRRATRQYDETPNRRLSLSLSRSDSCAIITGVIKRTANSIKGRHIFYVKIFYRKKFTMQRKITRMENFDVAQPCNYKYIYRLRNKSP